MEQTAEFRTTMMHTPNSRRTDDARGGRDATGGNPRGAVFLRVFTTLSPNGTTAERKEKCKAGSSPRHLETLPNATNRRRNFRRRGLPLRGTAETDSRPLDDGLKHFFPRRMTRFTSCSFSSFARSAVVEVFSTHLFDDVVAIFFFIFSLRVDAVHVTNCQNCTKSLSKLQRL